MSILLGSFHQGDERFNIDSCGKENTGIAAVTCVAFFLLVPNTWTISDTDFKVIVGVIENVYHLSLIHI